MKKLFFIQVAIGELAWRDGFWRYVPERSERLRRTYPEARRS